jgi:dienelactone hydrolase
MTDVLVFHHSQGLTPGIMSFAQRLSAAGHRVATPDLYDGELFDTVDNGVAYAEHIGFDTIIDRAAGVASSLDDPFVCIGFSLGVLPAQNLAQSHRRARGAVLCHGAVAVNTFANGWPDGVELQLHSAPDDRWGDHDEAVALAAAVPGSELFTYDTTAHLVVDDSLPTYDATIADQIVARTLALLDRTS